MLSYVHTELLVFQLVPVNSCPFSVYHEEKSGSVFYAGIYTHWSDLAEPSLLWDEQSQPSQPFPIQEMLQALVVFWPFAGLVPVAHICLVLDCSVLGTTPDVPHQCWTEGKNHLLPPAGDAFPSAALLVAFVTRSHCWFMFNLESTRTHRSFSAQLLSTLSALACTDGMGLFQPRERAWHFPLLNFMRLLLVHFSHSWGPFDQQHNHLE